MRVAVVFAAMWWFVGVAPAFGEDHGSVLTEGGRGRYLAPQANDPLSLKRKEIYDGVQQMLALIKTQNKFPADEIKEALALLEARLGSGDALADLFPDEKMDEATQRLFLDNASLILEYAVESLSIHMADPTANEDSVRNTAAQNMKKKWARLGESRKKNWMSPAKVPLLDLGADSPSANYLWIGRGSFIYAGNGDINKTFIKGLMTKLQPKAAAPAQPAAGRPLTNRPALPQPNNLTTETRDFIEQIKTLAPDKQKTAQKVAEDYEVARKDFEQWYGKNIRGKGAGELGEDLLRELKRRSAGVARLEQSLKQMFEVPADFKEAVERFRKDPKKFAEEEADVFIKRLRREDPERAKELEDMVASYKSKLQAFQAEVAKLKGKKPGEISRETLERLRRESKLVANLEEDIGSVLFQFEEQKEKIEREVKKKVDELARHLDKNYKRVLEHELKGIDKELDKLGGEVEKARRDVEQDLKKLEGLIFGKK